MVEGWCERGEEGGWRLGWIKKRELSLDQGITLCTRCGQLGVVKILLGKGEFVDAKDEEGETPLHKAARQALD